MRLTTHFTLEEFERHEKTPDFMITNLVDLAVELEHIRDIIQIPIIITSGYRSPERNKAVGGASKSYHMQGRAADIKTQFSRLTDLQRAVLERANSEDSKIKGVGIYKGHIHVDIRPGLNLTLWRA